jgi:putative ABC transport system permease protein
MPARTRPLDVLAQAVAAVAGRRPRSALTAAGVALGVAAAVATVGVTGSAAAAVSDRFDAARATLVTVRFPAPAPRPAGAAAARVRELPGVRGAGLLCPAVGEHRAGRLPSGAGGDARVGVLAAQPEALAVLGVRLTAGRSFDAGHAARGDRVALVERSVAGGIGVDRTLYLDGVALLVLGVFDAPPGDPRFTGAVVLPYEACRAEPARFEPPEAVIRTAPGAADRVGDAAPLALRPEEPGSLAVLVPPDLRTFRRGVEAQTRALLLGLAAVSLVVGALGVSNTMLVSVLERRAEIGLRRAVGASRRAVAGQFLVEGALLGLAGGALGAVAGVDATLVVAWARGWVVVLDPGLAAAAPLLGAAVGTLAGAYPAWVAARVPPAAALRS